MDNFNFIHNSTKFAKIRQSLYGITLAIISNYSNTKIYEGNKSYLIKDNTLNIIKKSCEYFGSTFEGRRRGTRILTGYSTKSPIIIEESKDIIFFPTSSPRSKNCSWISLNNVKDYRKIDKNTEIIFKNMSKISVNISYYVFTNLILRATRLNYVLNERKIVKKAKKTAKKKDNVV